MLVTVGGTAGAAWGAATAAGTALVDEVQRRVVESVTADIESVAPALPYPPDQAALDQLRATLGDDTMVRYRDRYSSAGSVLDLVSAELQETMRRRGRLTVQRVTNGDRPYLVVATPVVVTAPDGERRSSGIEVYAVRDLSAVGDDVDQLVASAWWSSGIAVPVALVLALLAARGVLRPVRDLRDAAHQMAEGDLSVRLTPRDSDELAELTTTVNAMAASLETSTTRLRRMEADARRFAADVSHDLRTPLTTLTAVVEVLEAEAEGMSPEVRESVGMAVAETRRLTALVNDLMEISRFDAGAATLRLEHTDVAEAIRDCLRSRGWLDQVTVEISGSTDTLADRRRLDVIVANLVGNAIEHGAPPVAVTARTDAEHLEITVTDRGPGLPVELAPHLFDRFVRGDSSRSRSDRSGLGLAIVAENVRLHGGDVRAGNADGGGARFVVRLPRGGPPSGDGRQP